METASSTMRQISVDICLDSSVDKYVQSSTNAISGAMALKLLSQPARPCQPKRLRTQESTVNC